MINVGRKEITRIELDQEQEDKTIIRRVITKIYVDINGELKLI